MAGPEKNDSDEPPRLPSMFAGYGPGQRRGAGSAGHRPANPAKAAPRAQGPVPKAKNAAVRPTAARGTAAKRAAQKGAKGKLAPYLTLTAFLLALEGLVLAPVVMLAINSLIDSFLALYNGT